MTVRLTDFYADWCGPCKTQDPILEDLEADYEDVEFAKVDVDEEQDVANQYQVRSLPTLVIENATASSTASSASPSARISKPPSKKPTPKPRPPSRNA
jgi:Thioredoxin domain-containing protein